MSIAIKYWAFEQNGWGFVDESPPPPPVVVTTPSGGDEGVWVPVFNRGPQRFIRPPIEHIDPGFPQVLGLYDYVRKSILVYTKTPEQLTLFDQIKKQLLAGVEYGSSHLPFFTLQKEYGLAHHQYDDFITFIESPISPQVIHNLQERIIYTLKHESFVEAKEKCSIGNYAFISQKERGRMQHAHREGIRLVSSLQFYTEEDDFLTTAIPAIVAKILEEYGEDGE